METKKLSILEEGEVFELESGGVLKEVEVAYETYGELNQDRSNAVYICHALTGDAHVAGYSTSEDSKPGWWDDMIGPGKYIDTDKYFVICSNFLGGCSGTTGPSSINPDTGLKYGLDFPLFTIKDMARVHKMFVDKLGIEKLLCVIGGSMGGMHAMRIAIDYPEKVKCVVLIATTSHLGAQAIAFDAVGRNAILADKQFNSGQYPEDKGPDRGLGIARMIGHITYLSEEGMRRKFGRALRNSDDYSYDFDPEFSVETYLDHQGRRFVERFDANSYLYITRAMDYFDLEKEFGSLEKAFASVKARFFVVSYSSDWLFPPKHSQELVDALVSNEKDVSYANINSHHGHDAFLIETDVIGPYIENFVWATSRKMADSFAYTPSSEPGRSDYDIIQNRFVESGDVLDLGCGEGELLARLRDVNKCDVLGIDIDTESIGSCLKKGVPAVWADIEDSLESFADGQFDYVVLSKTLQTTKRPKELLKEIVRIGRKAVVTFPNFAHISCRTQLFFAGRAPTTSSLPYSWYDSPNVHFFSMKDFEKLCRSINIRIEQRIVPRTAGTGIVNFLPNLFGREAIYLISRES
ncbi:homoserine O-acetyltransferase MetX [Sedimentisphaera salicampi]|uniref:homoserine O-acetyltransferase MetX n=1 Tax=Sedimentisphaera salicampi TaxID=1941349 RepID=UPI000F4FEAB6|nr:homoserine O-acetyltransferase [Sedimentisphaera salicampi]